MERVTVRLAGRAYDIVIGEGAIKEASAEIAVRCPNGRCAVVSDENVWALHGAAFVSALRASGVAAAPVVVPPGEGSKSLARLGELYTAFHRAGITRADPVIAFGGGVVGDLAGFAAATYMRGVPFMQIPTTLLAQVDAGVGGKVAVNLPEGKNLAGCFYQPVIVVADTSLLQTLPAREMNAGMAEVVKHACLDARALWPLLENPEDRQKNLPDMIRLCCEIKASFVQRDERDIGARMLLNFGHTFAHAIEAYHQYEKYNHGEAVAMGMALAARTGERLGITRLGVAARLTALMEANGLTWRLADDLRALVPLMAGDKKNDGDGIRLALLRDFGDAFLYRTTGAVLDALFAKGEPDV